MSLLFITFFYSNKHGIQHCFICSHTHEQNDAIERKDRHITDMSLSMLKTKPDYTKFRSFGCACYPLMCPYNKHKLDFRSACCLFLGYSLHNKGYIGISSSGKNFISKHVVFNEDVFSYSNPQYGFLPALSTPSISSPIHSTLTILSSHPLVPPSPLLHLCRPPLYIFNNLHHVPLLPPHVTHSQYSPNDN